MSYYFSKHRVPKITPENKNTYWQQIHNIHRKVFLTLTRDQNSNIVVYTVNLDRKGNINTNRPLDAFWLDVDPSYDNNRTPQYASFSYLDHYVYGYDLKNVTTNTFQFVSKYKGVAGTVKVDRQRNVKLFINGKWIRHVHAHLDNKYSLRLNPFKFVKCVDLIWQKLPQTKHNQTQYFTQRV